MAMALDELRLGHRKVQKDLWTVPSFDDHQAKAVMPGPGSPVTRDCANQRRQWPRASQPGPRQAQKSLLADHKQMNHACP